MGTWERASALERRLSACVAQGSVKARCYCCKRALWLLQTISGGKGRAVETATTAGLVFGRVPAGPEVPAMSCRRLCVLCSPPPRPRPPPVLPPRCWAERELRLLDSRWVVGRCQRHTMEPCHAGGRDDEADSRRGRRRPGSAGTAAVRAPRSLGGGGGGGGKRGVNRYLMSPIEAIEDQSTNLLALEQTFGVSNNHTDTDATFRRFLLSQAEVFRRSTGERARLIDTKIKNKHTHPHPLKTIFEQRRPSLSLLGGAQQARQRHFPPPRLKLLYKQKIPQA